MVEIERGTDPYLANIADLYAKSAEQIRNDIGDILRSYVTNSQLDPADALQLLREPLTTAELDSLRTRLQFVEDLDQRLEIAARLNAPAYRARIQRLEAIGLSAKIEMAQLAPGQISQTHDSLLTAGADSYTRTVFDIQQGTGFAYKFAQVQPDQVEEVLKQNWSGEHYSKRIWANTDVIAKRIPDIVQQNMVTGRSWRRCIDDIDDLVLRGGQYSAERILRTETAYVANEMDAQAYEDAEVEKYEFVATLDNRTSATCQEHDGKRYLLSERESGINYPPLHPHCRSTTIEVFDDEVEAGLMRRARDPQTGETKLVPADMTYKDWKKDNVLSQNDHVFLPNGQLSAIEKGSDISKIKVFAGQGTNKSVHAANRLVHEFGGNPEDWKKVRGEGRAIDETGLPRLAELHWFENDDIGRVWMKVARWFE